MFNVGDYWVWKGQGLARIESIRNERGEDVLQFVIAASRTMIAVSAADAEHAIRRLVDRATAERVWAELKLPAEPDARTWEDRHFDYARTAVKGSMQDQISHLRRMYSSPFKPTFGERRVIHRYEELLLSELGHVLGRPTEDLRAEIESCQPAFAPTAGERPPEPARPESKPEGPTVSGFALLGSFGVEGDLIFADPIYISSRAARRNGLSHLVAALPGKWYGYAAENNETGRPGALVAVHATKLESMLRAIGDQAVVVARVRVDSGRMAVLDGAVRDEERFEDELSFRTRFGTILDRGCVTESGFGDGTYPISVVMEAGRAVYVRIDFE